VQRETNFLCETICGLQSSNECGPSKALFLRMPTKPYTLKEEPHEETFTYCENNSQERKRNFSLETEIGSNAKGLPGNAAAAVSVLKRKRCAFVSACFLHQRLGQKRRNHSSKSFMINEQMPSCKIDFCVPFVLASCVVLFVVRFKIYTKLLPQTKH